MWVVVGIAFFAFAAYFLAFTVFLMVRTGSGRDRSLADSLTGVLISFFLMCITGWAGLAAIGVF